MMNGNVLIKIKKTENLKTASGIVIAGVVQDMNIAEIVAIPDNRQYTTIARGDYGTPERNEDGTPKKVQRHIEFNVGDKVYMEKNFHHEYDIENRERVDHTIDVNSYNDEEDKEYDFFITHANDVMAIVPDGAIIGDGDRLGELYPAEPPKPIQQV